MSTVAGFKRVARDISDLCELQLQLLAVDGKVAAGRSALAAVATGLALAIGVSSITTLLLAAGWALHELLEWRLSVSLLVAAGGALVAAALCVLIAYRAMKQALASLEQTRSEFSENLRWIRSMMSDDAASASPLPTANGRSGDRFSRLSTGRMY